MAIANIETSAPRATLMDAGMTGTATWSGRSYGLTTDTDPVQLSGNSELTFNLAGNDGTLVLSDFGDAYPDLDFNVAWKSDGIRRTGGDSGTVDGWLYANGDAVAGTAHTSDAALAWAGERP